MVVSWCAREPRANASSRIRAPSRRTGGGSTTLARIPIPCGPLLLLWASGRSCSPFHSHRAERGAKHLSLLLGGPPARIGVSTRPRPSVRYPTFSPFHEHPPSASRAEFPAPTKTSRRQERRGGPGPPSPHPKQVGKRGQVTTLGAPGASGPEHPRSSARGTAPLGRAGRLLAPTPPCRVLKGAGGPAGLCPFGWEGHARDSGQPHGPLEALASPPFLHSVLQNLH